MNPNEAAEQVDVLIAGAGPTGLSTALALAPLGLRVVLADPQDAARLADPPPDGRGARLGIFALGEWPVVDDVVGAARCRECRDDSARRVCDVDRRQVSVAAARDKPDVPPGHVEDLLAVCRMRTVEHPESQDGRFATGRGEPSCAGLGGVVTAGDRVVVDGLVLVDPVGATVAVDHHDGFLNHVPDTGIPRGTDDGGRALHTHPLAFRPSGFADERCGRRQRRRQIHHGVVAGERVGQPAPVEQRHRNRLSALASHSAVRPASR